MNRKPYPSDVSDEEWSFVAPYLTLMTEETPQREYNLRKVFNGLRWIVRAGAQWRLFLTSFICMLAGQYQVVRPDTWGHLWEQSFSP